MREDSSGDDARHTTGTRALAVGALGVVFGDIGTSPLYALKESFHDHRGRELIVNEANVVGLLSLVFWALIIIISIKYLLFVMRADNHGEGGILALTALIRPDGSVARQSTRWLVLMGLFGASLLYGDGMITPAISVLAAVEGTKVVVDDINPNLIVGIAVAILVGLFSVQKRGTAAVGKVFGPIMVVWFTTLAVLGISHIGDSPEVFKALLPHNAIAFLVDNGTLGFLVLGSVFLVVTGGEALYADMGHFGRRPIQLAWYGLALPALLLNYFGQGAMLLAHPDRVESPFFEMAPTWARIPLVLLATMATVIASQALISGAFSLTRQAVQLGYLPRVRITHTSDSEEGQIYVPAINWLLLVACVGLVLGFRSSTNLAAAYGLAVTATMAITTILFYKVGRHHFGWSRSKMIPLCTLFLVLDLGFLGANLTKIPDGGWVPLVIGAGFMLVLTTWFAGRKITAERIEHRNRGLIDFVESLDEHPVLRGPGVGVYLGSNTEIVPQALSSHLRHASVLPSAVVVLAVKFENAPFIAEGSRLTYDELGQGVHRLVYHVGFSQQVDVPAFLEDEAEPATGLDFSNASFVLGRETLRVTDRPGMAKWRERLFVGMLRNATTADAFFKLPPERTIELGVQVEL